MVVGIPKTTAWGKLHTDEQSGELLWHSVLHHSIDVAACVNALLTKTGFGTSLAASAGLSVLDEVTMSRLSVLAMLHDLGKFSNGFQNKRITQPEFTSGHVSEAFQLLSGQGRASKVRSAIAPLQAWGRATELC